MFFHHYLFYNKSFKLKNIKQNNVLLNVYAPKPL